MLSAALSAGRIAVIGVAAAAVLGVWFYVGHLRDRADNAENAAAVAATQRAAALEAANVNAERAVAIATAKDRLIAAVQADRDAALRRADELQAIQREIDRAPDEDDGPVAPVLRRAAERLRHLDTAPGSGDPDRDGHSHHP